MEHDQVRILIRFKPIKFKAMGEMLDYLTVDAEHQLLKYASGKQIFCPVNGCGIILDYRKTVIIEFTDNKVITICKKCFESSKVQEQLKKYAECIKEITKFRKA